MSLSDFQKEFTDIMLRPRSEIRAMDGLVEGGASLEDRLGVYHNNIIGSLVNVLCATFPMIENLTGREFLEHAARDFIFENPPRGGCMHDYGAGFDAFIAAYPPARSLPYLPDVARLEFAVNHAYYAPDDGFLSGQKLAENPPDNLALLVFQLRKSAVLIRSVYPLDDFRGFCLLGADAPDLSQEGDYRFLVYRPDMEVVLVKLGAAEYNLLDALAQGNPMGQALDDVTSVNPDFDFTAFLTKHIGLKSFSSL